MRKRNMKNHHRAGRRLAERRVFKRRLVCERLEQRQLLAAVTSVTPNLTTIAAYEKRAVSAMSVIEG